MKKLFIILLVMAASLAAKTTYSQVHVNAHIGIGVPAPVVVYENDYPGYTYYTYRPGADIIATIIIMNITTPDSKENTAVISTEGILTMIDMNMTVATASIQTMMSITMIKR